MNVRRLGCVCVRVNESARRAPVGTADVLILVFVDICRCMSSMTATTQTTSNDCGTDWRDSQLALWSEQHLTNGQ